jgi:hypothetical protein
MYLRKDQTAPVEYVQFVDPFWFYWITLMSLVSIYLYHNCEVQRRNTRMLQEYEAFLRQSDERLSRLESEKI